MRFGKTDISNTKRFDGMSRDDFSSMFYLSMNELELSNAWEWVQKELKNDRKHTTREASQEDVKVRQSENMVKSGKRGKRKKTSQNFKSESTKKKY